MRGWLSRLPHLLANIPVSSRTPLALGISKGLEVLSRERVRRPDMLSLLVVVTDGRANAAMGECRLREELREVCTTTRDPKTKRIVIDTEAGIVQLGAVREIANWVAAEYVHLEDAKAAGIVQSVQRATLGA